ncbi:hypothetical protein ACFWIQ_38250, partial [Kitasatospora sp. NPDC127059]|uniref:hypothetical protein n=1 Tax=Kitasatospora sp. NPDC127059 TaxID=3347120 RepID=UPI00365F4D7C
PEPGLAAGTPRGGAPGAGGTPYGAAAPPYGAAAGPAGGVPGRAGTGAPGAPLPTGVATRLILPWGRPDTRGPTDGSSMAVTSSGHT